MPIETQNLGAPSLEVNIADIEVIAANLDAQAEEIAKPKKRRVAKPKTEPVPTSAPSGENPPIEPEVIPAVDPEFETMLVHGASQAIDLMRDKLELMEPGDTLRENVGKCLAKLVSRLKPMQAGPLSDVVTIAGYLGVWVLCGKDWSKKTEPAPTFTQDSPNS
jgi:hypothetical protein